MTELILTKVVLVRHKRLKGGRTIARNYRILSCHQPIKPSEDGSFTNLVYTPQARMVLKGTLIGDDFKMDGDTSKVLELIHPYLKKGFKTIGCYSITGYKTNLKGH